jgi:phosphopantetheinyl transferase
LGKKADLCSADFMPLIKIIDVNPTTQIGLWEITEEPDTLKWALQWGQEDIKRFRSFNDNLRSMHWLASRVLLRKLLCTEKYIDLQQDEYGKPVIKNFQMEVSISHSGTWVAVMLSDKPCGVDIQLMDRHLDKLSAKFVSDEERKYAPDDLTDLQLYVYWCAKEALYKLYGKKKLDFKEHMFIHPFEEQPRGQVAGRIEKDSILKNLKISYERIDGYMLAYVLEK